MIQHLYTLWNDHHNKSSYHLSPYKVIIILSVVFPILHPCDFVYFETRSLYFLIPLTICFTHPPISSTLATTVCSLYLEVCFCFFMFVHLLFFFISHIREIIWHLSFCGLFLLSIILSRPFHFIIIAGFPSSL